MENYGPVSLLSHIAKVSERVIFKQINNFIEKKSQNVSRVSGSHMAHSIL